MKKLLDLAKKSVAPIIGLIGYAVVASLAVAGFLYVLTSVAKNLV